MINQFHAPANLSHVTKRRYFLDRWLGGPKYLSMHGDLEKILCPWLESKSYAKRLKITVVAEDP